VRASIDNLESTWWTTSRTDSEGAILDRRRRRIRGARGHIARAAQGGWQNNAWNGRTQSHRRLFLFTEAAIVWSPRLCAGWWEDDKRTASITSRGRRRSNDAVCCSKCSSGSSPSSFSLYIKLEGAGPEDPESTSRSAPSISYGRRLARRVGGHQRIAMRPDAT